MNHLKIDFKRSILSSVGKMFRPTYKNGNVEFLFHNHKISTDVGNESYGRINVFSFQEGGHLSIGNFSSISEISVIMGGNHHMDITTFPFKARLMLNKTSLDNQPIKGIEIGNDCWIGLNAIILDGVSVGTGSIIGSGAVVTKSTKPYSISAGNPAIEVGKRFEDKDIEKLIKSGWWEYPVDILLSNIDALYSSNVDYFVGKFK